ncbi:MAG: hypothetical protein B7Y80_12935 [Hyphomicrobium sp. 32-62-53]|nr:MAG: hypothetical protein B7Y80_12935 [Hyphomicrobium sp. 32-62-53]
MRRALSTAVVTMFVGALLTPALTEERPTPIAPPKTMGDEGIQPPTEKGAAPEMGATDPAQIGAQKRMGDQGPLPATKGMSGATPQMNPPATPPADK